MAKLNQTQNNAIDLATPYVLSEFPGSEPVLLDCVDEDELGCFVSYELVWESSVLTVSYLVINGEIESREIEYPNGTRSEKDY